MKNAMATRLVVLPVMAALVRPALGGGPECERAARATTAMARLTSVAKTDDQPGEAPKAGGGWLGVQLDQVPPPLAAQLGTDERGVLVMNVVRDSPADKAGLERYDVVTAVDGEAISAGDIRGLSERIGKKDAGQSVKLTVLRGGQERKLDVVLGERPGGEEWNWKFERAPGSIMREDVRSRGRVLQRGPGGTWEMHDLKDLDALKDLPDEIQRMLPHADGRSLRIYVDNDRKMITSTVERDGTTVEVSQKDGGAISVRRKTGDSAVQEKSYDSADDLQKADPEAYEIFQDAQRSHSFSVNRDGRTYTFNLGQFDAQSRQWREDLQRRMEEAQRSFEEAMKQFHGAPGLGFTWPGGTFNLPEMFGQHEGADEDPDADSDSSGGGGVIQGEKPRQTFRVDPDGQIEVRIRKGDSELIKVFRDESDLQKRDAELYDAYRQVHPQKP